MSGSSKAAQILAQGTWLVEIYNAEKRITQLLNTASQLLSFLLIEESTDQEAIVEQFEQHANEYMNLLNEIQQLLRRQFRLLTHSNIGSKQLPIRANVYGQEKDFEIISNGLKVVELTVDDMIQELETEYGDFESR